MPNALPARNVAALLLTIALVFGLASAPAAVAQNRPAIGSVEVDVSQLRAKGLGGFADMIGDAVLRDLQAYYPTTPQGARLVVSLDTVFLTSAGGDERTDIFGGFDSFAPQDSLRGVNYLLGGDGRVIETYPLLVSSPAAAAGPRYLPLESERAIILARTYAQWVAQRF
ncbi:MAG TPA: hypothetical protein VLQ65_07365 [Saliniramus sp.]|nr:hypothetical protein [Saliniramus sp.]